jgi:perosamine synthetase
MHEQPALTSRGYFSGVRLPVTERLYRHGLYLPSGLTLTDADLEKVVGSLKRALEETS